MNHSPEQLRRAFVRQYAECIHDIRKATTYDHHPPELVPLEKVSPKFEDPSAETAWDARLHKALRSLGVPLDHYDIELGVQRYTSAQEAVTVLCESKINPNHAQYREADAAPSSRVKYACSVVARAYYEMYLASDDVRLKCSGGVPGTDLSGAALCDLGKALEYANLAAQLGLYSSAVISVAQAAHQLAAKYSLNFSYSERYKYLWYAFWCWRNDTKLTGGFYVHRHHVIPSTLRITYEEAITLQELLAIGGSIPYRRAFIIIAHA